jgi:hypothetical protein
MTDHRLTVDRAIATAWRRLRFSQLASDLAIALGIGLAIGIMVAGTSGPTWALLLIVGVATVGGLAATRLRTPTVLLAASELDARGACRNIVRTAAEIEGDGRTPEYVAALVMSDASRAVASLDIARLFPTRRPGLTLFGIVIAWLALLGASARPAAMLPARVAAHAAGRGELGDIRITVTPPAYTGRKAENLTDPARIDALAGSRIDIEVGRGAPARVETITGTLSPHDSGSKFSMVADGDGYISICHHEPPRGEGSDLTTTQVPSVAGAPSRQVPRGCAARDDTRKLIGLTVRPDRPPRVRITAPGKDLFTADARKSFPVTIEADDDMALSSLELRYTKVSGSGERFTFTEGELPVAVTRADEKTWKATGTLDLAPLKLEAGDMVVYRGVAADRRPGVQGTESDAFIVEITSPGMEAAEGFSQDDRQDKYALSQQMVILHTERLIAKIGKIAADSLAYESSLIAAEQRSVRAEFVFMMGGEVADEVLAAADLTQLNEEGEAANESEIAAGRLVNRGRTALIDAIRMMSRANSRLVANDPTTALPDEKRALVSLQEAFSRTRYILRALTQRERLDLSRRMTGALDLAQRDTRPQPNPGENPRVKALRSVASRLAVITSGSAARHLPRRSGSDRGDPLLSDVAQDILRIDPSDTLLRNAADHVSRKQLDAALSDLTSALRGLLSPAAATAEPFALRRHE